ncbi:hypothetical protein DAETH_23280 [Deinococcus aetherius]|uniref:Uncharacterized protein n=1 Tax=Deinococcus aetherius TaxID=200252 RepID=A0ABM8AFD2_9DEIO|nr:hypothetical protein [Deinococcus aetherius]BDP42359.1 hypothetical protein DAETH_23280 [Deinococcus aetherius]
MTRHRRARIPVETLLRAAHNAAERLTQLSRNPEVRREAANVAQAVTRLLVAIRRSGQGTKPPE